MKRLKRAHLEAQRQHIEHLEVIIRSVQDVIGRAGGIGQVPGLTDEVILQSKYHLARAERHLKNMRFLLKLNHLPGLSLFTGRIFRLEGAKAKSSCGRADLILLNRKVKAAFTEK